MAGESLPIDVQKIIQVFLSLSILKGKVRAINREYLKIWKYDEDGHYIYREWKTRGGSGSVTFLMNFRMWDFKRENVQNMFAWRDCVGGWGK